MIVTDENLRTSSARCKTLYIKGSCTVHWKCSQKSWSNFILRYLEDVLLICTLELEEYKCVFPIAIYRYSQNTLLWLNLATKEMVCHINNYDIGS